MKDSNLKNISKPNESSSEEMKNNKVKIESLPEEEIKELKSKYSEIFTELNNHALKTSGSNFLDTAEDFLEKLTKLDDFSECPTIDSDIDFEMSKELSTIQERRSLLEGVWDALLNLNEVSKLPRYLKSKGWISDQNKTIIDDCLKQNISDTYFTVLKMKNYKLKMRLTVNTKQEESFKASFLILNSNESAC